MGVLGRLEQLQLIVVTGKGGVGKSTVTAALGAALANRDRRVLLIEVDPRENLHLLLDTPPSGGEIIEAASNLSGPTPRAPQTARRPHHGETRGRVLARKVLSSPVHFHFTEGAPGSNRPRCSGARCVWSRGTDRSKLRRPDVVILDAPASGHGIAWMAAPQLVSEVISSGPIGSMATEIAGFSRP